MTLRTAAAPVTALSVLQKDGNEIDELLKQTDPLVDARSTVSVVSAALWEATLRRVGREAAGFLKFDLGEVMVAAWSKYSELMEAGQRTRDTAETELVDLAGRDLVLRQHPRVEVTWRNQAIASVAFEVAVDIRVDAVVAEVRGGALVTLTSGSCTAGVSLETHGVTIGPRTKELDPQLVVDLGEGVRLQGRGSGTTPGRSRPWPPSPRPAPPSS